MDVDEDEPVSGAAPGADDDGLAAALQDSPPEARQAVLGCGLVGMLREVGELHRNTQAGLREAGYLRTPESGALPGDYSGGVRAAFGEAQEAFVAASPDLADPARLYRLLDDWSFDPSSGGGPAGLTVADVHAAHDQLLRRGASDIMVLHNFLLLALGDSPFAAVRAVLSGALFATEPGTRRGAGGVGWPRWNRNRNRGGTETARANVLIGGRKIEEASFVRRLLGSDATTGLFELARVGMAGFALNLINGTEVATGSAVVWTLGYAVWRTQTRWRLRLLTGMLLAVVVAALVHAGVPALVLGTESAAAQWVAGMAATLPADLGGRVFHAAFGFGVPLYHALCAVHPTLGMIGTELVCYAAFTFARGKGLARLFSLRTAKVMLATNAIGGVLGWITGLVLGLSPWAGMAPAVAVLVSVLFFLADPADIPDPALEQAVVLPEPVQMQERIVYGSTRYTVGWAISRPSPGGPAVHMARCLALAEGIRVRSLRLAGC